MVKQYFTQAIHMLKENPLVNTISILGTTFSVAMILVIILVFQIEMQGFPPETNRDRMLYMLAMQANNKNKSSIYRSYMSENVVKECFYSLHYPEHVTGFAMDKRPVSTMSEYSFMEYSITYTDPGFWKVFDFNFIYGSPFSETDFESGIPKAVISEAFALKAFDKKEATGEQIILDNTTYSVVGVVKTVSKAANHAYADVWVPYTSNPALKTGLEGEGAVGNFRVILLAKNKKDFSVIRDEINQQLKRYNDSKQDYTITFLENPFTRLEATISGHGFLKKSVSQYLFTTGAILVFLLLIPALNLIGVVQSSVQKRSSEVGIRKAFGATRSTMMIQILSENLVTTAIGGIIGLFLSFLILNVFKDMLLSDSTFITKEMILQPALFISVIFFTLLLNILSAGIPAMRISRLSIINALNEKES